MASASILAIDLARHPSGAAVADVLDRVLVLTPEVLEFLGPPAAESARSWAMAYPGDDTFCGGLEGLKGLLRQVLGGGAPAPAVQVCVDAVTAAWAAPWAPATAVQDLREPWDEGVDALPAPLPDTTYRAELVRLLEDVVRRTPAQWQAVARAHAAQRGQLLWSTHMHTACKAAVAAGREVEVARAQLAAARALCLAGVGTEGAMAVTAMVQAVCTRDLCDTADLPVAWLAGS